MKAIEKRKIFNDPIYGFVSIPYGIILNLIDHPFFQRLRRIRQLGMTSFVYPGALHTRFHHALGSMYLMIQAIDTLRNKGVSISNKEQEGALLAILLHDIGHGPFSHALEHSLVSGIPHEKISSLFMENLNKEFKGKLNTAIEIFTNKYPKKFLHQLVSSQLDMDRLDYLKRDSFFTGVSEGIISTDRIIAMLNVKNDVLAVEEKGIYSVEKFIVARRLMYWQVYYHKTTVAAEQLLVMILKRAKELTKKGTKLFATPALDYFLKNEFKISDFEKNNLVLSTFAKLDDYDIQTSVKVWEDCHDKILAMLCINFNARNLFKVKIQNKSFSKEKITKIRKAVHEKFQLSFEETNYFVIADTISNNAYNPLSDKINILFKDGKLEDITKASDQLNLQVLSTKVEKFFLCYPREIDIEFE
ncbi:MAG: HD domain-containing protein [Bacteroidota bacterium]|jgi:HD superfamily phosphohydrolase